MFRKVIRRLKELANKQRLDWLYKPRGIVELGASPTANAIFDHKKAIDADDNVSLHIYILHDARLHTDCGPSIAAIDSRNRLVAGASWQYVNRQFGQPQENEIFRSGVTVAPRAYNGTVFSLLTGGGGNDNYYHWLFDAVPRLHLLRKSNLHENIDYFYAPALQYPFQIQSLECLGITQSKIIPSLQVPHIQARKIIMTDHPRPHHDDVNAEIPAWICSFLRDSFLKVQVPVSLESDKIYISRKDTDKRKILNEDELINALRRRGFVIICLTEYSFRQQVAIFARAKTIVSGHGAGLTNLTFCNPGTKVIEIFNETFLFRSYENISTRMNLDYQRVLTANTDFSPIPNLRDIVVDIPQVMARLERTKKPLEMEVA